ncbi:hypothetical protein RI367_007457 [Sorochytrium milnesiophthora]
MTLDPEDDHRANGSDGGAMLTPPVAQKSRQKSAVGLLPVPQRKSRVGEVFIFGDGDGGQLGLGVDDRSATKATPLKDLKDKQIVDFAAGGLHSLFLSVDGKVYSCGCNDEKVLGREVDDEDEGCTIGEIEALRDKDVVKLAAGDSISLALTAEGKVYGWGTFRETNGGVLGFSPDVPRQAYPTLIKDLEPEVIVDIACGVNHCLALSNKGIVYGWGDAYTGAPGFRTHRPIRATTPKRLNIYKAVSVCAGDNHSIVIDEDGDVFSFGLNDKGQCAKGLHLQISAIEAIPLPEGRKATAAAAGESHTLILLDDRTVLAFGRSDTYALGLGYVRLDHQGKETNELIPGQSKTSIAVPQVNRHLSDIQQVFAGGYQSFAINSDERIFGWGRGDNGQLGNAETKSDDGEDWPTPHEYPYKSNTKVFLAAAGTMHGMFLVERTAAPATPVKPSTKPQHLNGSVANGHHPSEGSGDVDMATD